MKSKITLATTTVALFLPLANNAVLAGVPAPVTSPCVGIIDSVEILGVSSGDARAEITCTVPDPAGSISCYTKNPLMIEAAADASLVDAAIQLAWETKRGTNWCTSLELSPLPDID